MSPHEYEKKVSHECENPEEIAYVRGLQRRSTALWAASITVIVAIATSIVWVGLSYGALQSDVEHLQQTQEADRNDIRAARQDILEQERRTAEHYQSLTEQMAVIATSQKILLEAIGGQNGAVYRRGPGKAR